jgi:hypothetical protein
MLLVSSVAAFMLLIGCFGFWLASTIDDDPSMYIMMKGVGWLGITQFMLCLFAIGLSVF